MEAVKEKKLVERFCENRHSPRCKSPRFMGTSRTIYCSGACRKAVERARKKAIKEEMSQE